jgi:hypothetical protein
MPGWREYITERKSHYADKSAAKAAMDKRHEQERKDLSTRQKEHRREMLSGSWRGRGELLNAMRSVLAAEQAAQKAAMKERQKKERERWRRQYRPYPDFETWLRDRKKAPELAEYWRHRDSDNAPSIAGIDADPNERPIPHDIRAYRPAIEGRSVHYRHNGSGKTAFTDNGNVINVYDWKNRDAVLATLQLSAQKWGRFNVTGNEEYKRMCARLAAEHGFKIANPELQDVIAREREQLFASRQVKASNQRQPDRRGMDFER